LQRIGARSPRGSHGSSCGYIRCEDDEIRAIGFAQLVGLAGR